MMSHLGPCADSFECGFSLSPYTLFSFFSPFSLSQSHSLSLFLLFCPLSISPLLQNTGSARRLVKYHYHGKLPRHLYLAPPPSASPPPRTRACIARDVSEIENVN